MIQARCARCPWSCRARDHGDAQDVLVSHHNLAHGRRSEPWTPYSPPYHTTPEALATALQNPVTEPLTRYGVLVPRQRWWTRLTAALLTLLGPAPRGYRPGDSGRTTSDLRPPPPTPPPGRGGGSR